MKISTKGIYALEIISDLAIHTAEGSFESLNSIADRRGLSLKYIERIIKELKKAGLVLSVRGAYGGYRLGRPAPEITVRDVLTTAEGELAPVDCLTDEADCKADCKLCPTRGTWDHIWRLILDTADEVTIADIIRETKK